VEALNTRRLARLARLHHNRIPGAQEQLGLLIEDRGTEVRELLGLPHGNLTADRVTQRVEELAVRTRREAQQRARQRCLRAAQQVASGATRFANGSWVLPTIGVAELCHAGGFTHVAFGDQKGVDLRTLRGAVRACRNVQIQAVQLTATHLELRYEGPWSRGRIALIVRPCKPTDDVVAIHLGTRTQRPLQRHRGRFLDHLEQALREAIA